LGGGRPKKKKKMEKEVEGQPRLSVVGAGGGTTLFSVSLLGESTETDGHIRNSEQGVSGGKRRQAVLHGRN